MRIGPVTAWDGFVDIEDRHLGSGVREKEAGEISSSEETEGPPGSAAGAETSKAAGVITSHERSNM